MSTTPESHAKCGKKRKEERAKKMHNVFSLKENRKKKKEIQQTNANKNMKNY